jgi:hypothetical protein
MTIIAVIPLFYLKFESLVLWARSEIIGSALDQLWFLVSGVRCQENVPIMGVQNIPRSRLLELTGRSGGHRQL